MSTYLPDILNYPYKVFSYENTPAIFSSGAYSITEQAKIASKVTGYPVILGVYDPLKFKGKTIIFGNPSWNLNMIIFSLKHTQIRVIMTTEGRFDDGEFKFLWRWLKFPIYAVSKYAKAKIEESGYPVEDVIYHEIDVPFMPIVYNRTNKYLYIAGYLRRKWPPGLGPLLSVISKDMVISTTLNNPYLRDYQFKKVYLSPYASDNDKRNPNYSILERDDLLTYYMITQFYTNLSDAEGFGLTPLEAMALGAIPVVIKHPVFVELLGDCPYYVDYVKTDSSEYFPPIYIEHYVYNAEDYLKVLMNAKWTPERALKCQEKAMEYRLGSHYKRLLEI